MTFYLEPSSPNINKIKFELDLFNCATKSYLKRATGINKSGFAKKTDLPSIESNGYKLDTDKSKTNPNDLSNLSNVTNNDVFKSKLALLIQINKILKNKDQRC